MRSISIVFVLFFSLALHAGEIGVRPLPSWVERVEVDVPVAVAKKDVRWGIYDLLADHQVRTGDGAESHTYRTVRKVLSASGVQNASELSLDFDPSFETLTVHEVSILRDGRRIDALEPEAIRVIEKEEEADNRIYDGQQTALLFLKDVRAGDVIDYSWSIEGANPILGGRYTDEYDLSSAVPARRIRHRLLWPAGRPLQWQGADPAIGVEGSLQIYVWERANVPALGVEDSVPSWYEPWAAVQVTEFESWREVAQWAAAMFTLDRRSLQEVRALAESIRSQHPSRGAQATAAIRFVQDEIRYLGIEMGRNSHEPHPPWQTLAQRWGDCKDKTLLLVALLRALGLEAWPALVSTRLQHRIEQKLPSPFLFDHVIAQVVDGGRVYWIDATISDQGGTLATIETPNDERALIVRDGTSALTTVKTNTHGSTLVEQTYTTIAYDQPVLLEMRTTWSGRDADSMRAELAALSIEDIAGARINRLAIDQPKIEADGPPAVTDDRDRNVIVYTERYLLEDLWAGGEWSWYPRVLESFLTRPETMIRSMPLAFSWPLNVEQRAAFNFPDEIGVEKSSSVTETSAFRYEASIDSNGRTISLRQTLRAKSDAVAADEVPDHLTKLSAISSELGFHFAPAGARPREARSATRRWLAGFGIVALFVGVSFWFATRRAPPAAPAAQPVLRDADPFLPGDAPVSALAFSDSAQIEALLATRHCSCGARHASSGEVQRARYADREMTIVVRRCSTCGLEQSTYFTAA